MSKPDFSGRWRCDPARSNLQIQAPDSTLFVVEHREPLFRLSRTHEAGGRSDTFSLDLTTDGKEVRLERAGATMHARAFWEGETLIFHTRLIRGGEEASNIVRYTLAADRSSFTAEERFRSRELNYDNLWVLEREPPAGGKVPPAGEGTP